METDIRDIKGLVPVPYDWWWLWLLLLAAAVAVVVIWLWKRRKPAATGETPVPPSAFEVALAALQRLRQDNPPVEEFYTRLSDIVRRYIEGQFGLRAPERTTEEFLEEATLPPASMTLLGAFLQESDLVKFARFRPGEEDKGRAFDAAEKFVRETQPRAQEVVVPA
jgi:hypothetical protein